MKHLGALLVATSIVASAAAVAQAPSDAQIASIVVVANQVDIDAGHLAESRASAADVKAFARQMITDHTGVNKRPSRSSPSSASRRKTTPRARA